MSWVRFAMNRCWYGRLEQTSDCLFFAQNTRPLNVSFSLTFSLILTHSMYLCISLFLHSCCLGFTLCSTAVQCNFFFFIFYSCRLLALLMFMCVRLYWFDGLKSSNHPHSVQIHWIGWRIFFFLLLFHAPAFLFSLLFKRSSLLRIYVVILCVSLYCLIRSELDWIGGAFGYLCWNA